MLKPGETLNFQTHPDNAALLIFNMRQGIAYCKRTETEPYNHIQVNLKLNTKTGLISASKKQLYDVVVMDEITATKFNHVIDLNGVIVVFYQNPGLALYEFPNLDAEVLNEDLTNFAEANKYKWRGALKQLEKV